MLNGPSTLPDYRSGIVPAARSEKMTKTCSVVSVKPSILKGKRTFQIADLPRDNVSTRISFATWFSNRDLSICLDGMEDHTVNAPHVERIPRPSLVMDGDDDGQMGGSDNKDEVEWVLRAWIPCAGDQGEDLRTTTWGVDTVLHRHDEVGGRLETVEVVFHASIPLIHGGKDTSARKERCHPRCYPLNQTSCARQLPAKMDKADTPQVSIQGYSTNHRECDGSNAMAPAADRLFRSTAHQNNRSAHDVEYLHMLAEVCVPIHGTACELLVDDRMDPTGVHMRYNLHPLV